MSQDAFAKKVSGDAFAKDTSAPQSRSESEFNALANIAIALLARREYAKGELQERLMRKTNRIDLVVDVLSSLEEQGLQSDERFSEHFVKYRIEQGKGPHYIRRDLRQKSVSDALITKCVPEDSDFWAEKASEVYKRKFKEKPLADENDKAKRLRFMVSRGFSAHQVYSLLE